MCSDTSAIIDSCYIGEGVLSTNCTQCKTLANMLSIAIVLSTLHLRITTKIAHHHRLLQTLSCQSVSLYDRPLSVERSDHVAFYR